jgi:hypothetical protein
MVIAMILKHEGFTLFLNIGRTQGSLLRYGTKFGRIYCSGVKSITRHECTIGDGQHAWPPFSGNYGNGINTNIPSFLPMSGTLSPHAEIKMHPFCHTC